MKRISLIFMVVLVTVSSYAQTPFDEYGYKAEYVTFSQGKFDELHDKVNLVEIGDVVFNAKTKKIVSKIGEASLRLGEVKPEVASRFISIDPHAERYYSISPYVYCMNNPVNIIDPDGRDIWEINRKGEITWKKPDDENRLYALDENGNQGKSITLEDESILKQLSTDRKGYKGHYGVSDNNEVADLFLFAANNSDVEWGLKGYNTKEGMKLLIGTSNEPSKLNLSYGERKSGLSENQLAFDIHSHPSIKDDIRGASGGENPKKLYGDMEYVVKRYYRMSEKGLSLPPHYVYHRNTKTLYHYTPWESSIYIRKITSESRLEFLLPKKQ